MCGKFGHVAAICFHRFDKQFTGSRQGTGRPTGPHYSPGSTSNQGRSSPPLSNTASSSTAFVSTTSKNLFVTNSETGYDSSWYVDSGASNHVTRDYSQLMSPIDYGGKKTVKVGNGNELPISHLGSSVVHTNAGDLNLENVLCVPAITKNLVSVSKLASDNNVFTEFHDDFCLVKDKGTGSVVLTGTLKDGLYQLDPGATFAH